jgi:hypothetical protein
MVCQKGNMGPLDKGFLGEGALAGSVFRLKGESSFMPSRDVLLLKLICNSSTIPE